MSLFIFLGIFIKFLLFLHNILSLYFLQLPTEYFTIFYTHSICFFPPFNIFLFIYSCKSIHCHLSCNTDHFYGFASFVIKTFLISMIFLFTFHLLSSYDNIFLSHFSSARRPTPFCTIL